MLQPTKVSHHASGFYNFKDRFEPKGDTIDKFEMTTVSVPLLAGLSAAIGYIEGIGLEPIARRCVELASYATGCLAAIEGAQMISQPDPAKVASGIVSFALPAVPPATLTAHLWETARIIGRTIPDAGGTRFCFHVFNTKAEVDAATEAIRSAAKRGVPNSDRPSIQIEWDAMVEL
jgi:selenocysteine lyase/cysteine desulfurase